MISIPGRIRVVVSTLALTFFVSSVEAFYSPEAGRWLSRDPLGKNAGENLHCFVGNAPVGVVDGLGLLEASVVSVQYAAHGSVEIGTHRRRYIEIDGQANKGEVPLDARALEAYAGVHAVLDDRFAAAIEASTTQPLNSQSQDLQMSTFLQSSAPGAGVKVSCPCPFRKVQAKWDLFAEVSSVSKSVFPKANAAFEGNLVLATPKQPSQKRSGVSEKTLDWSYSAYFGFNIGQAWFDTAPSQNRVVSKVSVTASFTCVP